MSTSEIYKDYHTFGSIMPGRNFNSNQYRYGFNGQEKVDEISGSGNHNTALFGELDTRLGRRWNLDPKPNLSVSQYAVFGNNPIWQSDFALDTPSIGNRIIGGLKTVGGAAEMTAGAIGGAASSWTGIGAVVGGAAVVHGADVTSTGFKQMWTGEDAQTLTAQGISGGLQTAGVSETTANAVSSYMDTGLSIALTAGASYRPVIKAPNAPIVANTVQSTELVTKYPANAAVAGTTERTFLMPGQVIDRFGSRTGNWFSLPGTSYGARSIPPGLSPYNQYTVLKPFEVQGSLASPGFLSGQVGFGPQFQSPVSVGVLLKKGIIK